MTHPDILRMEKLGVLEFYEPLLQCDMCSEDIYEGEDFLSDGHSNLCMDCVLDSHKTERIIKEYVNDTTDEEILLLDGYRKKIA